MKRLNYFMLVLNDDTIMFYAYIRIK